LEGLFFVHQTALFQWRHQGTLIVLQSLKNDALLSEEIYALPRLYVCLNKFHACFQIFIELCCIWHTHCSPSRPSRLSSNFRLCLILSDAVEYTLYRCCIWCHVLVTNQTLLYCIREIVFFPHCGHHHHHHHHHHYHHHHVVCLTTGPWPLPNEFSRECDLMLPVSTSSTFLFP
jgi:hypothetical protein